MKSEEEEEEEEERARERETKGTASFFSCCFGRKPVRFLPRVICEHLGGGSGKARNNALEDEGRRRLLCIEQYRTVDAVLTSTSQSISKKKEGANRSVLLKHTCCFLFQRYDMQQELYPLHNPLSTLLHAWRINNHLLSPSQSTAYSKSTQYAQYYVAATTTSSSSGPFRGSP